MLFYYVSFVNSYFYFLSTFRLFDIFSFTFIYLLFQGGQLEIVPSESLPTNAILQQSKWYVHVLEVREGVGKCQCIRPQSYKGHFDLLISSPSGKIQRERREDKERNGRRRDKCRITPIWAKNLSIASLIFGSGSLGRKPSLATKSYWNAFNAFFFCRSKNKCKILTTWMKTNQHYFKIRGKR